MVRKGLKGLLFCVPWALIALISCRPRGSDRLAQVPGDLARSMPTGQTQIPKHPC